MSKFKEELKKETNPAIINIANYLLSREDIKTNLEKENKSLHEMFQYIMGEAKKKAVNNCACLSDEDVYGLAVHYYDEDDIKINYNIKANVKNSISNTVKKEDDKDKLKNTQTNANLYAKTIEESHKKIKADKKVKNKKNVNENQLNLFDMLGEF